MRFRAYKNGETRCLALKDGDVWRDLGESDLTDLIRRKGGAAQLVDGIEALPEIDISAYPYLPPIPHPSKIICVGLNYLDHAAESPYSELPDYPSFFPRFASSLVAHEDPIICPSLSKELDFEGELVVVIGKRGRYIAKEDALAHVAGYSIFNDASIRDYQFKSSQWTVGKNFDGTGAFGPDFVTADEVVPGAVGLEIETILNGETVQKANTRDLIYPVADLISIASDTMTLEVGDIIVSGTPAGVGFARDPQLFMKDGDTCEVRIEGIGSLTNPVRNEAS